MDEQAKKPAHNPVRTLSPAPEIGMPLIDARGDAPVEELERLREENALLELRLNRQTRELERQKELAAEAEGLLHASDQEMATFGRIQDEELARLQAGHTAREREIRESFKAALETERGRADSAEALKLQLEAVLNRASELESLKTAAETSLAETEAQLINERQALKELETRRRRETARLESAKSEELGLLKTEIRRRLEAERAQTAARIAELERLLQSEKAAGAAALENLKAAHDRDLEGINAEHGRIMSEEFSRMAEERENSAREIAELQRLLGEAEETSRRLTIEMQTALDTLEAEHEAELAEAPARAEAAFKAEAEAAGLRFEAERAEMQRLNDDLVCRHETEKRYLEKVCDRRIEELQNLRRKESVEAEVRRLDELAERGAAYEDALATLRVELEEVRGAGRSALEEAKREAESRLAEERSLRREQTETEKAHLAEAERRHAEYENALAALRLEIEHLRAAHEVRLMDVRREGEAAIESERAAHLAETAELLRGIDRERESARGEKAELERAVAEQLRLRENDAVAAEAARLREYESLAAEYGQRLAEEHDAYEERLSTLTGNLDQALDDIRVLKADLEKVRESDRTNLELLVEADRETRRLEFSCEQMRQRLAEDRILARLEQAREELKRCDLERTMWRERCAQVQVLRDGELADVTQARELLDRFVRLKEEYRRTRMREEALNHTLARALTLAGPRTAVIGPAARPASGNGGNGHNSGGNNHGGAEGADHESLMRLEVARIMDRIRRMREG